MISAAAYQAALAAAPIVDVEDLIGTGGIVVIAPHPDDESLGCGGLIREACIRGRDVRIVVVSDGTASHPGSRTHPRPRLRALRREESLAAAAILGVPPSAVCFLDLPDSAVPRQGPGARRAAAAIRNAVEAAHATAVFVTSDMDPHCDHAAAATLAADAVGNLRGCRLYCYPIWAWTIPPQTLLPIPAPEARRIDISAARTVKLSAIAAHGSQLGLSITDDPTAFRLDPLMIDRLSGRFETFVRVA